MSDLRWILLLTGLVVLAAVFLFSRRRRETRYEPPAESQPPLPGPSVAAAGEPGLQAASAERVVAIRLMSRDRQGFPGEALVLALREAGLRHGQFGIFHRYDPAIENRILFSVASLVEPGTFDLSALKSRYYPGVSMFLVLPGAGDRVAAFDDMLATARILAATLDGELLDEQGSRLSVQRERYLREEVIQFRAARSAS